MLLFFISLLAGALTVLSPCVLPFLPIAVGGSLAGGTSIKRALVVTISLGISVFLFTLLLKVSTIFIHVPPIFWTTVSGVLIAIVGFFMLFPKVWDAIPFTAKMNIRSNDVMSAGFTRQNFLGDVLVGAALGPVFSTCSPTYFIVLATVLPVSLYIGIADILAYIVGLCLSLLLIAFVGQRVLARLDIAADPNGPLKRTIGAIFILIGILIVSGLAATIEAPLYTIFDETKIEQSLLSKHAAPMEQGIATSTQTLAQKMGEYHVAPELVAPDGYLNTDGKPITLAQYRGKNVVLIDFWTYSCINCQRTLPYLNSWYAKYKDQGLVIIGVHTPEFAFEHVQSNVAAALTKLGIKYPVVLDNEYKTWDAYGNQFWPHDYVIDIDGFITHDHVGEGDYDVTEKAIQAALAERAMRLGTSPTASTESFTTVADPDLSAVQSPETYFGAKRNEYLSNGTSGKPGSQTLTIPTSTQPNSLYLGGTWDFNPEYAETAGASAIQFTYTAHDVYFVSSAKTPVTIQVFRDGKPVGTYAGADVDPKTSTATISENRLYTLVHDTTAGQHTILIKVLGSGLDAYTFTFG